jgi:hypothetical protein
VFDVYLDDRRNLLVLKKGAAIPASAPPGTWRKKKRVVAVGEEIRSAVEKHGYYTRKLSEFKKAKP